MNKKINPCIAHDLTYFQDYELPEKEQVMKSEMLQEGWVRFRRYKCKEGHIDFWIGDSINDPNNKEQAHFQLNSFAEYIRLNNNPWAVLERSDKGCLIHTLENSDLSALTAEEIYKKCVCPNSDESDTSVGTSESPRTEA